MATDSLSTDYIGYQLEVFVCVFVVLQIIAVALRWYARSLTATSYGLDDWLVIASLVAQFVAGGIAIGCVQSAGVGYHLAYVEETNPPAVTAFFKYLVALSAWYYITISIAKLAICVVYHRLFPQRQVHIFIYILAGVMISTAIASFIADLAACKPFSANWGSPDVQATHCIDKEALFIWSTFPNIVTDACMLVLPLPIIWRLHTSIQLKAALTVTFVIGSMGLVASIMRFRAFVNTNSFTDATYAAVELVIWTNAEPGIYLLCSCILMYRPLLEKIKINLGTLRIGGYRNGTRGKPEDHRPGGTLEASQGDIAMRNWSINGGFEQLSEDASDHDIQKKQDPFSQTSITVTTKIQQSWEGS